MNDGARREAVVIHNPQAGARVGEGALAAAVSVLEGRGFRVRSQATTHAGQAADLAHSLAAGAGALGLDIVAFGGDGTLNELAWGLARAGVLDAQAGAHGIRLGILPAGSTNVVARDLGLPLDPVRAAATLSPASTRRFDVGVLASTAGARPFLLAAGVGFEAEAVARVNRTLKGVFGRRAYIVSGLLALLGRDPTLAVEIPSGEDGGVQAMVAAAVSIVNTRHYGGPAHVSQDAAPDDGVVELVLHERTGVLRMVRIARRALAGGIVGTPGVRVLRVQEVTVTSPRPVACHVDAEVWGTTPARVHLLPRALELLAPG